MSSILINLSRVGKNGSGLYVFSKTVIRCLEKKDIDFSILTSNPINTNKPIVFVPEWVTNTPKVSFFRPILWFIYSLIWFPKQQKRTISTTHHVIPFLKHQVVTIHDLRTYFLPDTILQKIYMKYFLPCQLKKVDGILTVSEFTKKMLIEQFNVPSDNVHVVPNCVDISAFKQCSSVNLTSKRYLLMVGATWKHKNAHELINNFDLWINEYDLKIVCGESKYCEQLINMVEKFGIENNVHFINYVEQYELISLYQKASALVYPSLMEGFGIPPLEAMACGLPVIVSDIPVFREIYGDIPIYIELGNKLSWEKSFMILKDKSIVEGKINQGVKKAKEYTEDKMYDSLINSLDKIWSDLY